MCNLCLRYRVLPLYRVAHRAATDARYHPDVNPDAAIDQSAQNWTLVAGLFCVLTVSSGLGFYNLSLYMNVLASHRAFSVTEVSSAVGIFFLAAALRVWASVGGCSSAKRAW